MSDQGQSWYDDVFSQIYRFGHRYTVEAAVVLIGAALLAFAVHLFYGSLVERQKRFAISSPTEPTHSTAAPITQKADHSDCSNVVAGGNAELRCTPVETEDAKKP